MAFINEPDKTLKAQATISEADIAAARAFVRAARFDGQMVKNGRVKPLLRDVLKQFWDAVPTGENGATVAKGLRAFVFDKDVQLFFTPMGQKVVPEALKAASEMIVNESQFRILQGTLDLQNGVVDLDAWYQQMKVATKELHIAQGALGSGGWQGVTPGTVSRLEDIVTRTWLGDGGKIKGLKDFATRLDAGEYGAKYESGTVRIRAKQYALAGRATKENEAVQSAKEDGHEEGRRVLAAVDNCPGCIEAANDEWVDIDEVLPIGDAECGPNCITTPDSRVLTRRGWVPISRVRAGDFVWTHNLRWRRVTATMVNLSGPKHRGACISTPTGRPIGVTRDHQFHTANGWVEIEEIIKRDMPLCYNLGHESTLSKVRRLWRVGLFVAGKKALQGLWRDMQVWQAKRMALRPMQGVWKSRSGACAMVEAGAAGGYPSVHQGGRAQTADTIQRSLVGVFQGSKDRGRAVVRRVLGRAGCEALYLPLSVGLDCPQWADSRGDNRSSHQWRLHRRPARESSTDDTGGAFGAPHKTEGQAFAGMGMPQLSHEVQGAPERQGQEGPRTPVLFPKVPLCTSLYDLTVEEDHSFCIEGLFAHNCHCTIVTRRTPREFVTLPDAESLASVEE